MFGRKKKALDEALCQERMAHASDLQELHKLRSQIDSEKQSLKNLQDTYRQKLRELETNEDDFQEERARRLREVDEEVERRRSALDEEIRLRKKLAEESIQKNLTALQDNYSYYLSQLKLLMDVLTKVSITVGETVLTREDMDTAELFQTMFSAQIGSKAFPLTRQDPKPEASPGGVEEDAQSEGRMPGGEGAL